MKKLIKRELFYFYLKRPFNFLWFYLLNLVFLLAKGLTTPQQDLPCSPDSQYTFTMAFSLLIPLFMFAFFGGMSMDEIIHKEKIKKYFESLIALSYSPLKIILSKIISLILFLYFIFTLSLFTYVLIFILSGKGFEKIFYEGKFYWLNFLVFSPLIGISILNIEALFYFILKDQRTSSFFSFFFFGIISFKILFIALASPYDFFIMFFLPIFSIISIIGSLLTIFVILKIVSPENYILGV
ncbi:MAG: hypothetical protein ABDH37_00805 [Candidatus Hydrothermales bacterium]